MTKGSFDECYAESYDALYDDKDYALECRLITDAIARHSDFGTCRILDVGCGTGKHSLRLARLGYRVTGVEPAAAMLARATAAARELPETQQPSWIHADAKSFVSSDRHEVAVLMFAVLGYLGGNVDALEALRNIRRHVLNRGLLICDFWYGPGVLHVRPSERVKIKRSARGTLIRAASTELDSRSHTALVSYQLWQLEGDRVVSETRETHRMRFFFPLELELLLGVAAFELLSLTEFPSLDKSPSDETWNALAIARAI